jgi:hypothetical protein
VRVLTDGADGLTKLVSGAAEKAVHRVLDWFHINVNYAQTPVRLFFNVS